MALWQFDLRVVPRQRLESVAALGSDSIQEDVADSTNWWGAFRLPPGWTESLHAILPRGRSWDAEWEVFGDENGTRVDLITHGDHIEEIRIRLDARELEPKFLQRLLDVLKRLDIALITTRGHIVRPEVDAVWVELQLSAAKQFVRDPEAFLNYKQEHSNDGED